MPRLWLQVGLILLFVVLTAWRGLAFHRAIGPDATLPFWTPLVDALQRLGDRWFSNGNYVANPVTYAVLPLAVLLLAGARFRALGFGSGHRVGRAPSARPLQTDPSRPIRPSGPLPEGAIAMAIATSPPS